MVDYQLSWALTDLKREGLVENPQRGRWRLTLPPVVVVETAVDDPPGRDRLGELRAMPYDEYLRTPEWRRTRTAALIRAGHRCALDVAHTEDLDVHHNTYERRGAELQSDLVVLCRTCHHRHHASNP
jgi:restriction endonuclease Mrr